MSLPTRFPDGLTNSVSFVDDVLLGSLVSGTIPDDEYMATSFGCQNGEAIANTMTVSYIFAAMER